MPGVKLTLRLAVVCSALAASTLAAQDLSSRFNQVFDGATLTDAKARELWNSARIAIFGGPGGIARLKSMRFKGHSRFHADDGGLTQAAVEIRVLLPERYLRIDSGTFGRRLTGLDGNTTTNLIEGPDGKITHDPDDARAIRYSNRSQLARLMLGVATYASQANPLTLQTRGTPREMPGPSDPLGIDVVGDDGWVARLVLEGKTHLPLRIQHVGADKALLMTLFTDRRSVGGMKVPYSIVTRNGDNIIDEMLFDDVEVNPTLTKADFSR